MNENAQLPASSLSDGYRIILAVDFFSKFSLEDEEFEPGAYLVCRRQRTGPLRHLVGTRNTYETTGYTVSTGNILGSIRYSGEQDLPYLQKLLAEWYEKYAPVAMTTTCTEVVRRFGVFIPKHMKVLILHAK